MSTALATVSTGTSLALFWRLLEGAHPPALFCPAHGFLELHWLSLLLGLLCGILLGPLLEALVAVRLYLYQRVVHQLVSSSGAAQPRGRGWSLFEGATAPGPLH